MTSEYLLNCTHDFRDSGFDVTISPISFVQNDGQCDNYIITINNVRSDGYRNPSDHVSGGDMFGEVLDRIMDSGDNYKMNITIQLSRE